MPISSTEPVAFGISAARRTATSLLLIAKLMRCGRTYVR